MATLEFVTLDVFTTKTFHGNPLAAVFLPPQSSPQPAQHQKQTIAREFHLSETIFIHPKTGTGEARAIDIFTESTELPFAGHPSIGAASWFLHHAPDPTTTVTSLNMKAGNLPISLRDEKLGAVAARVAHDVHVHGGRYPLDAALQLHPSLKPYLAPSSLTMFSVVKGMNQLLVELPSLEALDAVTTAYGGKTADSSYLDAGWGEGLLVTYFYVRDVLDEALGRKVVRTRATIGTLEDPATGSAAGGLAACLSLKEGRAGRFVYDVVQGVEMGRRSEIGVGVVTGDKGIESLELRGSAVKVSEGSIVVPSSQ